MLWRRPDRDPSSLKKHYDGDAVRALRAMLDRQTGGSAILTCVTNLPDEASAAHVVLDLPRQVAVLPSQFPKLWLFSKEFSDIFGAGRRFLFTDLDVVLVGDPGRLLADAGPLRFRSNYRRPEDAPRAHWKPFPTRKDVAARRTPPFSTSLFVMTSGLKPEVWDRFRPARARRVVGWSGTDQKWVNWVLGDDAPRWPIDERFVNVSDALEGTEPPSSDAVVVTCSHRLTPWDPGIRVRLPWLADAYPLA